MYEEPKDIMNRCPKIETYIISDLSAENKQGTQIFCYTNTPLTL